MKGVRTWLDFLAGRDGSSDFCPALAGIVGPVQMFSHHIHYFTSLLFQLPSKLGRQSCRVNCLLICVSGVTL